MTIERMKEELRAHLGHLDWYLTNRQVRRMYQKMVDAKADA
jgi:hypothetical protein